MISIFLPFWIHQTEVKQLKTQTKDNFSLLVAHKLMDEILKQRKKTIKPIQSTD